MIVKREVNWTGNWRWTAESSSISPITDCSWTDGADKGKSKLKENQLWVALVKKSSQNHGGLNLNFVPLTNMGQLETVKLEMSDVEEGIMKWKHAVIRFTLGQSQTHTGMRKFVETRWKEVEVPKVVMLKNGPFVFKSDSEEGKIKALEKSP